MNFHSDAELVNALLKASDFNFGSKKSHSENERMFQSKWIHFLYIRQELLRDTFRFIPMILTYFIDFNSKQNRVMS